MLLLLVLLVLMLMKKPHGDLEVGRDEARSGAHGAKSADQDRSLPEPRQDRPRLMENAVLAIGVGMGEG